MINMDDGDANMMCYAVDQKLSDYRSVLLLRSFTLQAKTISFSLVPEFCWNLLGNYPLKKDKEPPPLNLFFFGNASGTPPAFSV